MDGRKEREYQLARGWNGGIALATELISSDLEFLGLCHVTTAFTTPFGLDFAFRGR